MGGNDIEAASRLLELRRLDLPDLFAPLTRTTQETSVLQNVQVLRDRLASDIDSSGQSGDRGRPARAQAGDQAQTRFIAERREHRRSGGESGLRTSGQHT
jgi:hypothetical protein